MSYIDTLTTAQVLVNAKRLKAEIEAKQQELAFLTTELAGRVTNETGTHNYGDAGSFVVSENNVYVEAAIRAALSPGQVRRCQVTKIDNAVVKRLYPEAYNGAKQNKGVKVTLK